MSRHHSFCCRSLTVMVVINDNTTFVTSVVSWEPKLPVSEQPASRAPAPAFVKYLRCSLRHGLQLQPGQTTNTFTNNHNLLLSAFDNHRHSREPPSIPNHLILLSNNRKMADIWKKPEKSSFQSFMERSISKNQSAKQPNMTQSSSASNSGQQTPMPKPKTSSEFPAWAEYTGSKQDVDDAFVAWKKEQVGETRGTQSSKSTMTEAGHHTTDNKAKENKKRTPCGRIKETWKALKKEKK